LHAHLPQPNPGPKNSVNPATNSLDSGAARRTLAGVMSPRITGLALLVGLLTPSLQSADEAPRTRMQDLLRERIAADAKKSDQKTADAKKADAPKTAPAAAKADGGQSPAADKNKKKSAITHGKRGADAHAGAGDEAPAILPKMEVKKSRITELDQKLAKQELDIERERKNLKASEVDTALNTAKIARPLAIFGGESSQFRQRVASERVELMEAEKDLIEAIAHARTKDEKQKLQKQLDEIKAFRRDLERALR
jgi:hypothetical protein